MCQPISANPAHSPRSQFPQSILSCWRILQDCISALMIPCLLYQYSTLTSTEVPFFCLLRVEKWIFMAVQGHSWFLMLSYFVPKFLGSGIRSLCSEVWSYQLLHSPTHFYPFCIIFFLRVEKVKWHSRDKNLIWRKNSWKFNGIKLCIQIYQYYHGRNIHSIGLETKLNVKMWDNS